MRNAFSFKPDPKKESRQNSKQNRIAGKEASDTDTSDTTFAYTSFKPYILPFDHPKAGEAQPSQHSQQSQQSQQSQPTTLTTPTTQNSLSPLSLLTRHNALPLRIMLMTLVFITALYTKAYTGDYQLIVNNHVGGLFYVMFGSLAFSMILPRWKHRNQVLLALAVTSLLELVQWMQIPFMVELARYKPFAYVFGNSYNPLDFVYYVIGAVLGMGLLMLVKES